VIDRLSKEDLDQIAQGIVHCDWGEDIAWLWAQVAQAALTRVLDDIAQDEFSTDADTLVNEACFLQSRWD
jgi:hypothetical protein